MKYTNILEKLLCLFDVVKTSWMDITFLVIVVVSLILLFRKKISSKTCYIINVISSIALIGMVIYNNIDTLSKTFETILDYTFKNIYFPSIYVYLIILLVVNVFCILSLVKVRLEKKYKVVNGTVMLIINFILALILDVIANNEIDLFKKESIFASTDLVVLMELSINIFLVWCAINLIMYLADNITEKVIVARNAKVLNKGVADMTVLSTSIDTNEVAEEYNDANNTINDKETVAPFIPVESLNINVEDIKPVEVVQNKFVPNIDMINNNIVDNGFDLSSLIPTKSELKPISNNVVLDDNNYVNNSSELLNSILNNDLPFIIKEEKNERDTYTLNDYRIFNKMLKDIKEHNNSSRIVIDKTLEYRLITKYSTEAYEIFKRMLKNYSN